LRRVGGELVRAAVAPARGPAAAWGLMPVPAAVAQTRLEAAGERGLAAPVRRRRPTSGGGQASWRAGAGAVLTCEGPSGTSAQAVVALAGAGDAGAIAPPPGGALVLRAWR